MIKRGFSSVHKLVMLRHGESVWNKENRFTGWKDVELSQQGVQEAKTAGQKLKDQGFQFDQVYTSVLKRAIMTYNNVANELDCNHLPVQKSWRLNERHYGALQGLNKAETAEKHGEKQVKIWRRSYDIPPPALEQQDERNPSFDSRYQYVPKDALPLSECLKDCVDRVLPYWFDEIGPQILKGQNVLIVAHGNSLRSIVKYLDNISEADIMEVNIPTAVPLVYELDKDLKPIKSYYLLSDEELKQRMDAVAKQGQAQK